MSKSLLRLYLALTIVGLFAIGGAQAVEFERRILVPTFEGASELGTRVANVLALQVAQTSRSKEPHQTGEPYGRGVLLWDPEPLKEMSYQQAMRVATQFGTLAHLVLWGRAYEIGEDVVVQAYLTATPVLHKLTQPRFEVWRVEFTSDQVPEPIILAADLPSSHFVFSPVTLSRKAVDTYKSIPALTIFSDRDFKNPIGTIGSSFLAKIYEPGAVLLRSEGQEGWVPLPNLSEGESEVSMFTGALFRMLRGDWSGATDLLDRVLKISTLPQGIRIDALLLKGLALEKLGKSGLRVFIQAMELNPFRAESCRYLIQSEIAALMRLKIDAQILRQKKLEDLNSRLMRCNILFNPEGEWLENVNKIIASYKI